MKAMAITFFTDYKYENMRISQKLGLQIHFFFLPINCLAN